MINTIRTCCFLVISALPSITHAAPRVVVLDVGEGQAVLLADAPHGILIDTGRAGIGRKILQSLQHYGVEQLDYLLLTHLHPDHIGSFWRIAEAFPEAVVADNCHPDLNLWAPDVSRWLSDDLSVRERRNCLRQGDVINWRDSELRILWPQQPNGRDMNAHSLALLWLVNDKQILVMGDANQHSERQLLADDYLPTNVDLLVAGHHGSKAASTLPFLKKVKPEVVAISVNANNLRGYPHEESLHRLQSNSKLLLRTDIDGDICFDTSASNSLIRC